MAKKKTARRKNTSGYSDRPGKPRDYYFILKGKRYGGFASWVAMDAARKEALREAGYRIKNGPAKRKKKAKRTKRPAGTKVLPIARKKKRPAAKRRKRNGSKIPAKVLAGHKRIWGGRIPPGALAELEKTYAREALAKKAKRKNPAKRKAAKKRPAAKRRKRTNPANNKGIVHLMRFGRAVCGARGHQGTSDVESFRRESKPCKRCAAKLATKKNPCGKRKRKANGEQVAAAARMFKKFHGKAATGVRTVKQLRVTPSALADCGKLIELVVDTGHGGRRLSFGKNSVRTATTGDGGQLYFVGGDQALKLEEWPGLALPKDQVALGELASICYHTSKDFHNFEPSDYEHAFGETGKARPVICYDVHSRRLYLVGGGYQTKRA